MCRVVLCMCLVRFVLIVFIIVLKLMFLLWLFMVVLVEGVKIGLGSCLVWCRLLGRLMLLILLVCWQFFQLLLIRQLWVIVFIGIGFSLWVIIVCLVYSVGLMFLGSMLVMLMLVRWLGIRCVVLVNQKFDIWQSILFLLGIGLGSIMLKVDRWLVVIISRQFFGGVLVGSWLCGMLKILCILL